jgi:hypothetical protein
MTMHQHDGYQPHSHEVRADHGGVRRDAPDDGAVEQDWRAMREYLIKALADARRFAARSPMLPGGFEGQAEVLSSALDFMDERERAHLRGRCVKEGRQPQ